MRIISEEVLDVYGVGSVTLPVGANILSVQSRHDKVIVFFAHNHDAPLVERVYRIFQPKVSLVDTANSVYVGTVQMFGVSQFSPKIYHVFFDKE